MNNRFILRKIEMKYYSVFMHKCFARKKKMRNLRVPIFKKHIRKFVCDVRMRILIMYGWGFKIYKICVGTSKIVGMTQQQGRLAKLRFEVDIRHHDFLLFI